MGEKARIAVIGTGWWSTFTHIPGLQANPSADLVAICDANEAKLRAAATTYHLARTYQDHQAMLDAEALDGVVVATNHASHFPLVRDCLERGLHVMVEKPMVLYASEARTLVELAQTRERELIIGYPYHFMPQVRRVRAVLQAGELGAIQYVNCFFTSNIKDLLGGNDHAQDGPGRYPVHGPGDVYSQPTLSGGGHGHLQITHSAGLMFFVTGLRARRVQALMRNHGLPLDLVDVMTVEFAEGAIGSVGGTGNLGGSRSGRLGLLVYAEDGVIEIEINSQQAAIYRRDHDPEIIEPPTGEAADYPRFATANNLVQVILGRAENESPAEIGWRTVELLDAAYRSAAQDGQAVLIEDLYGE
jgi:predicted dehydrogenase